MSHLNLAPKFFKLQCENLNVVNWDIFESDFQPALSTSVGGNENKIVCCSRNDQAILPSTSIFTLIFNICFSNSTSSLWNCCLHLCNLTSLKSTTTKFHCMFQGHLLETLGMTIGVIRYLSRLIDPLVSKQNILAFGEKKPNFPHAWNFFVLLPDS